MEATADQENVSVDFNPQDLPPSSPLASSGRGSSKPKKPPTVTPKRFSRFFNPRSSRSGGSVPSRAGRELRDITQNANNRHIQPLLDFEDLPDLRPSKRRKALIDKQDDTVELNRRSSSPVFGSSPPRSSPCPCPLTPLDAEPERHVSQYAVYPQRIRRAKKQHILPDWRSQTCNFYTRPEDAHSFTDTRLSPALPFSTAACNTNSLVAIGDEAGFIRILETARDNAPSFNTSYVRFRPHLNAIMDLAFSEDDRLLATASGDQTSSVIDMRTQQTLYRLCEHESSVKQVAFQPGNDNVLATCSRDGTVGIWDLRCHSKAPRDSFLARLPDLDTPSSRPPKYGQIVNTFCGGHLSNPLQASASADSTPTHQPRPRPSITALAFLGASRPHHFLTATDSDARLRLWDLRISHNRTRAAHDARPLATTAPLQSHLSYRHFGIASLALSSDASRLYSLCRDSSVHVYSAPHIALGLTPPTQPLYALRHPSLRVSSFYVRCAIRRTSPDAQELLALGSGDSAPIVVPTDERVLRTSRAPPSPLSRPRIPRTPSSTRLRDSMPVFAAGTALVRGHAKEVTGVTWARGGELVSIGDDYVARCWREDAEPADDGGREKRGEGLSARSLRMAGEGGGRRWECGWADGCGDWDDSDG